MKFLTSRGLLVDKRFPARTNPVRFGGEQSRPCVLLVQSREDVRGSVPENETGPVPGAGFQVHA